jgi:glyoxylase-like metal-dependent hydrolase (beta-lactamase superfamily II)
MANSTLKFTSPMKAKKLIKWIAILMLVLIAAFVAYMYPTYRFFMKQEVLRIDDDLTLIQGGGGNSGVLVTDSAVVVIDTKMGAAAKKLYKLAKEKAGSKPIIVIDTHFHGDHANGNYLYQGCKKYMGNYEPAFLALHMKAENRPGEPVKDSLRLDLGNEVIWLYDLGQAHTTDDLAIYLVNRKMIFTGDVVFNHIHPALFREEGTNIDAWIIVLDRFLSQWDYVSLVPGHGGLGGNDLALQMKQYFEEMRAAAGDPAREKDMIAKYDGWMEIGGMTSAENTLKFIRESR